MTKEVELTKLTSDLILETEKLKKSIREEMMVGEKEILKGIVFFEEVIKEMNPNRLDDEVVYKIRAYTTHTLSVMEEKMQKVNNHMHLGIVKCFWMLDGYNRKTRKHQL